jgi:spore maturation protein CgeB
VKGSTTVSEKGQSTDVLFPRILYVAMKYDYGKPENGYSFEHCNFYDSLKEISHEVIYFDFMTLMQEHGQDWMNQKLVEIVETENPDFMFTVLFTDEINPETIKYISDKTRTITFNWFCDDHWRFDEYTKNWAPLFNWVSTTASSALPKYEAIGYSNVIKTQWACNHFAYKKNNAHFDYDVTFIGQPHGNRRQTIEYLRQNGIRINVWGNGWDTGRLSQEEMIRVFNSSLININLSNSSTVPSGVQSSSNIVRRALSRLKQLLVGSFPDKLKADVEAVKAQQIKGRNFEVPGCGGFLLTDKADNLEDYYLVGKEIVCFEGNNDLIEKIKYYLEHEEERIKVAQSGYERTLREHTYVHRFNQIFNQINSDHVSQNDDDSLPLDIIKPCISLQSEVRKVYG